MKYIPIFMVVTLVVVSATAMVEAGAGTPTSNGGDFWLRYSRSGGIAGVNDTLLIAGDGSVTFTSRYGHSFSGTLGTVEFSELRTVMTANIGKVSPAHLVAKSGAADYFSYGLEVRSEGVSSAVSWVDRWATDGPIPEALVTVQDEIQKLVIDLTSRHTYVNSGASTSNGLKITILTDRSAYKVGEQLSYVVIIENGGSRDFNFTSPTPCDPAARVVVMNSTSAQDISSSENVACIQVLQGRVIHQNTYLVQNGEWNLSFQAGSDLVPASPGVYSVRVRFPFATFEKTVLDASVEVAIGE